MGECRKVRHREGEMPEIQRNAQFDISLNDAFTGWKFGEYYFEPSDILFNCDPIMYREAVLEFQDFCDRETQHSAVEHGHDYRQDETGEFRLYELVICNDCEAEISATKAEAL